MRELHVIALSEDGRSLLLATSKDAARGGFRVALDGRLAAAVRGDVPRVGEDTVRASALTPKEIQARLRAGESPAEIAREAGVAVARVERFSGPVLSERARVIDAARSAYVVRGRLGRSVLPLGEAVTATLESSSGYRADSEEWTTRRQEDGRWEVSVSWHARARTRAESWTWDPTSKDLLPVEASAAVLGHTEAPRPSRRSARSGPEGERATPATVPHPPAAPAKAARTTAPGRAGNSAPAPRTKAAPAPRTTAAPAKAVVAAPAKPTSAAAPPAPAGLEQRPSPKPARRTPVRRTPARQEPASRTPASQKRSDTKTAGTKTANQKRADTKTANQKRSGTKTAGEAASLRATAAQKTARVAPAGRRLQVVPDPDVKMARRTMPARATVPGWADVLLGATPVAPRPQGKR